MVSVWTKRMMSKMFAGARLLTMQRVPLRLLILSSFRIPQKSFRRLVSAAKLPSEYTRTGLNPPPSRSASKYEDGYRNPIHSAALYSSLRYKLISFLGPEHVQAASAPDVVAGVWPKLVIVPGSGIRTCGSASTCQRGWFGVVPRGGGTKTNWGNPPARADCFFSTARLETKSEHAWADLTVSVGAGCDHSNAARNSRPARPASGARSALAARATVAAVALHQ